MIDGFETGKTVSPQRSPIQWTPVFVGDQTPGILSFSIAHDIYDDIRLFQGIGPDMVEYTDKSIPPFDVKVEWENGVPRTRLQNADNFNMCFLQERTGIIGVVQYSLITLITREKKAHFFVGTQELYVGQTALITVAEAQKLANKAVIVGDKAATMLPVHAENAHHMANPWTMFPECRPLVRMALESGAGTPFAECINPKWTPTMPALPANLPNGGKWVTGVDMWFNIILGKGFVLCSDGRPCHVEREVICNDDGTSALESGRFPALRGSEPVALKYQQTANGKRQALMVLPLKG